MTRKGQGPLEGIKNVMKKNLLLVTASFAALVAAAPAFGADLAVRHMYTKAPPAPIAAVYDWTGFYIGVNGGWGSSHNSWDFVSNSAGALPGSEGSHDATGGTVGGQIGYRWQMGQVVFGVEGQGNWADFSGSNVSTLFPADVNRSKVDAFGLITGQIGYAWNNVLLYVNGGAAVTGNRYSVLSTATGAELASADDTRWGGAVGVGFEVGFAQNWSAGLEYDHLFMSDSNVTFTTPAGAVATDSIRQDVDLVTARINYRFGGPIISKY
jgi:outer membrane immunogenic protein